MKRVGKKTRGDFRKSASDGIRRILTEEMRKSPESRFSRNIARNDNEVDSLERLWKKYLIGAEHNRVSTPKPITTLLDPYYYTSRARSVSEREHRRFTWLQEKGFEVYTIVLNNPFPGIKSQYKFFWDESDVRGLREVVEFERLFLTEFLKWLRRSLGRDNYYAQTTEEITCYFQSFATRTSYPKRNGTSGYRSSVVAKLNLHFNMCIAFKRGFYDEIAVSEYLWNGATAIIENLRDVSLMPWLAKPLKHPSENGSAYRARRVPRGKDGSDALQNWLGYVANIEKKSSCAHIRSVDSDKDSLKSALSESIGFVGKTGQGSVREVSGSDKKFGISLTPHQVAAEYVRNNCRVPRGALAKCLLFLSYVYNSGRTVRTTRMAFPVFEEEPGPKSIFEEIRMEERKRKIMLSNLNNNRASAEARRLAIERGVGMGAKGRIESFFLNSFCKAPVTIDALLNGGAADSELKMKTFRNSNIKYRIDSEEGLGRAIRYSLLVQKVKDISRDLDNKEVEELLSVHRLAFINNDFNIEGLGHVIRNGEDLQVCRKAYEKNRLKTLLQNEMLKTEGVITYLSAMCEGLDMAEELENVERLRKRIVYYKQKKLTLSQHLQTSGAFFKDNWGKLFDYSF